MYTISKEFAFEASHKLVGLPEGHQCGRLHGHSYRVMVVLQSETLNRVGFVRDFGELSALKQYLDTEFDHRHLNDVTIYNPTAEIIAELLFYWCHDRWPEVVSVSVSETAKTWATFSLGSVPSDTEGETI